ncbi:calcium-binding protein [Nocardioides sp. 616]|uniref:calcium-binding protein n=1 Tax=Nocardioides sp. 616 TaxID=2268090 RepID=UPI0013B3C2F5|nr:calcium-binding protein [Nocardioides sp. 616]
MRSPTITVIGLALALSVVAPVCPAGAAPQADEPAATCDGKVASIVVPEVAGRAPRVVGTPGDDVIVGTEGTDRIDGAGGNDTICGLAGDDEIIGGPGDDRLFGGDDLYSDDYWGDLIQPGPGDDYVDLGADTGPAGLDPSEWVYADKVSYADAPGPVTVDLAALTATGDGTDTFAPTPADKYTGIIGSPYDDVLIGGPAPDQILGGGGDDVITGGPGDDELDGDATRDRSRGSKPVSGDDVVSGGPGDDVVSGGYGTDRLSGEDGDDSVIGLPKAIDTKLLGGPGDDLLATVAGTVARGGSGDDLLRVEVERNWPDQRARTLKGGGGRDRVEFENYGGPRRGYDMVIQVPKRFIEQRGARVARLSGVEEFVFDGNAAPGMVTFQGGGKPELFQVRHGRGFRVRAFGGGGKDVLIGGERADLLVGGPGRDRLNGDRGRDRCLTGEQLSSCERRR